MLALPRLPVLGAGCRGPLATCCGRGCAGVGARHCPFGLHALCGAACCGVVGGRPGGVASHRCEGRLVSGLSLSRAPIPGGGQPGHVARVSRARVVWAWGTQHWPHSVRSCEPALRTVGVALGRPRGGCLAPL